MNRILTFLVILMVFGCTDKVSRRQKFLEVQLSYSNGWHLLSSIKIAKEKIFVRDNVTGKTMVGQLNKYQLIIVDSFLSAIDIWALDSTYQPEGYSISDRGSFRIYFDAGRKRKTVYFNNNIAPIHLENLVRWLKGASKEAKTPTDTSINFKQTDQGFISQPINDGG